MKLYRFDSGVSHDIRQYGSHGLRMSALARDDGSKRVDIMHVEPGGVVGEHEATANQIFAVMHGSGWVRSNDDPPSPIAAGQAAFWQGGERHESGSETGMTVVVVEGESVDPESLLPALEQEPA